MSTFLLCPNTDVSPSLTASSASSCNKIIWGKGKKIDTKKNDLSNLEFLCETLPSGKMTDYAVSDLGCPVISERFKAILDDLGVDNIEYFKARVIEREGEESKTGYYAANILGLIDCIDRQKSEMDAEEDDDGDMTIIFRIDHLVLRDDIPTGFPLFRAAYFKRLIVINDYLKQGIENHSLTGIRFVMPERWDGFNGER